MRALWTVSTIFRAPASLDRQQSRDLHLIRVEMGAMDRLGLIDQVVERQSVERQCLLQRPVMTVFRALVYCCARFVIENHARALYIALG